MFEPERGSSARGNSVCAVAADAHRRWCQNLARLPRWLHVSKCRSGAPGQSPRANSAWARKVPVRQARAAGGSGSVAIVPAVCRRVSDPGGGLASTTLRTCAAADGQPRTASWKPRRSPPARFVGSRIKATLTVECDLLASALAPISGPGATDAGLEPRGRGP